MLTKTRITIVADTVVDDTVIASHGAILDIETNKLSLTARHVNTEACKQHKDIVREDRAKFEDFAYSMQDMLLNTKD